MTNPTPARLFQALDATWSAAQMSRVSPWMLREGMGGGQRVSAATAEGAVTEADIPAAEAGMRAFGQRPLFMIREGEDDLDRWLEARSYEVVDPVILYVLPIDAMAQASPDDRVIMSWPMLAIQAEIWREGGIGGPRLAVMERSSSPKTALLGRSRDRPAATGFVALDDDIAMVHALEVRAECRRRGLGRRMMGAAAHWAADHGARWMTLAVVRENVGANALYRSLGMYPATSYHYRRAPLVE